MGQCIRKDSSVQATNAHSSGTPFSTCKAFLLAVGIPEPACWPPVTSVPLFPRLLAHGPLTQAAPTWPSQQVAFQQLAQQDLAHPVAAWSHPHLLGQGQGSLEVPWQQRGTPAHQQRQQQQLVTPAQQQQRGRQGGWSTRLASALPVLQTCR